MALEIEGVVDGGVGHFALSPPHRLMRVFGTIISPQPFAHVGKSIASAGMRRRKSAAYRR
jgi:hypothetical protein